MELKAELLDELLRGVKGEMEIAVPRDRNGTFEPQLVRKHQTPLAPPENHPPRRQ